MTRWALVLVLVVASCDADPSSSAAIAQPKGAATDSSTASQPTTLAVAGRIAFVSERDGDKEVYLVEPRTGATRRLTRRRQDDYLGPPSPRGEQLLLISAGGDGSSHREQMWLLSSAGGLTELGSPGGMVRNPAWLPDGSAVVVESNRAGFRDLYLVPLEGEERQLTDVAEGCFEPDVRADGKALVYVSSQEGNAEIFTRALAGGEPQRLTWSPGGDTAPRWSPDGRQIAWASVRHGHALAYVMNADGSKPRPLATGSDGDQEALSWSSNGEAIAFTERNGNTASVRVVAVDDGRVLFDSRARTGTIDEQPALSADGRAIAFVSDRDGDAAIYAATLHDGAIVRLTRSRGADWLPRWWDGDADD